MSVTAAKGFTAAGIAAGIKDNGDPDLALVVNTGPRLAAAGVFTSNRVKAAPVLWSEQVLRGGQVSAVVLNSGGDVDTPGLDAALREATRTTFDRVDPDSCMSTNDTVLLLASGASGAAPQAEEFAEAVRTACGDLAAGTESAVIRTNDLTSDYVHENSAYSS